VAPTVNVTEYVVTFATDDDVLMPDEQTVHGTLVARWPQFQAGQIGVEQVHEHTEFEGVYLTSEAHDLHLIEE
jgi:hypothetical protein